MKENIEEEIEKLKDLKAVYSGAMQAGEISIANIIKGGISLIEKLQKENEELKADNYELNNRINDLLDNIPIQKVKDKIEEEKLPLVIVGGRRNKKTLEYGIKLGKIQALQELLESEGK